MTTTPMTDIDSTTRLKFLTGEGLGPYSDFKWPLPHSKNRPGKWIKAEGPLIACKNGIHVCTLETFHTCSRRERLYTVETRGEEIDAGNKIVVREARLVRRVATWNDRTARLFACDFAELMLRQVTRRYGKQDPRIRAAIQVARKFARSEACRLELKAAREAARQAAWEACGAAREAAWEAWEACGAARGACESALEAERQWQTARLAQYLNGERT